MTINSHRRLHQWLIHDHSMFSGNLSLELYVVVADKDFRGFQTENGNFSSNYGTLIIFLTLVDLHFGHGGIINSASSAELRMISPFTLYAALINFLPHLLQRK